MSSPPHACRRGGDNPMITDGAAAAVPTFTAADTMIAQVCSCAPLLSPDASREHAAVPISAGDEAFMGAGVPSSKHAAVTDTHVVSERMIEGSANSTSTAAAATMINPSNLVVSASDTIAAQVEVDDTNITSPTVPKVGMTFESEEDAYEFYNAYAGKIGFSIRKSHSKLRPDRSVYKKHIVCSNEGERGTHSKHDTMKQNAATRSRCDARVQFSISRDGIWRVQKVVLEHNHYLASPDKKHMLRSQRRLVESDKLVIGNMREAGLRPAEVYKFFKQWYGGPQNKKIFSIELDHESDDILLPIS